MKSMQQTVLILCACALAACAGCRRSDPRQAMIDVPAMRGPACAKIVREALHRVHGIDRNNIEVDMERRRVLVPYDSMIVALKNLEHAIADAGFDANDIPANPDAQARLPETCRGSAQTVPPDASAKPEPDPPAAPSDESAD